MLEEEPKDILRCSVNFEVLFLPLLPAFSSGEIVTHPGTSQLSLLLKHHSWAYTTKFKLSEFKATHHLFPPRFCVPIAHIHMYLNPCSPVTLPIGCGGGQVGGFGLFTHKVPPVLHLL